MTTPSERHRRAMELFLAACELPDSERDAMLVRECASDAELRREVEELLREDSAEHGPLAGDDVGLLRNELPESIAGFRVIEPLGSGGMGVVYLAEQEQPRRTVALKVLHGGVHAASMLKRFEREAELLGRLAHPGIARVYQAGTAEVAGQRQPYIAMEVVEGESITAHADRHDLQLDQRLELMASVCDAVEHAHAKNVIHRDLKPGNVLVDSSGQPKVLDFGIARATDADVQLTSFQTGSGQILGTLAYMSPEQASGDPSRVDHRCDVWSLGILLYELVTGQRPFDVVGRPLFEAVRRLELDDPTPPSRYDPKLANDVETILGKALEKDPERRYGSAAELAADVRRYLRLEPITARPPSATYRLGKFVRRNRMLVNATVLVFAALVIGLAFASYGMVEARSERDQAQRALADAEDVTRFLEHMFETSDPYEAGITDVASLLHAAADDIAPRFGDRPAVEGRLRLALGTAYLASSDARSSRPQLERALELLEETRGPADPLTFLARQQLAHIASSGEEMFDGIAAFEVLLEDAERAVGPQDVATVRAALTLADFCLQADKHDRAEEVLDDVEARMLSPDVPRDYVHFMTDLRGQLLEARGRIDEAQALLESTYEESLVELGPTHRRTLNTMDNLAQLLLTIGDFRRAAEVFEEQIRLRRERAGPDDPQVVGAELNLANAYTQLARHDESLAIYDAHLARYEERLGSEHPSVLQQRLNRAAALNASGRKNEALLELEDVLRIAADALGPDAPETLDAESNLGSVYVTSGRAAEAIPYLESSLAKRKERYGVANENVIASTLNLGRALVSLRRSADAEALLAECEREIVPILGDDAYMVALLRVNLGLARIDLRQFETAEAVLVPSHAILLEAHGEDHVYTKGCTGTLIRLYDRWGRADQAAAWRAHPH